MGTATKQYGRTRTSPEKIPHLCPYHNFKCVSQKWEKGENVLPSLFGGFFKCAQNTDLRCKCTAPCPKTPCQTPTKQKKKTCQHGPAKTPAEKKNRGGFLFLTCPATKPPPATEDPSEGSRGKPRPKKSQKKSQKKKSSENNKNVGYPNRIGPHLFLAGVPPPANNRFSNLNTQSYGYKP